MKRRFFHPVFCKGFCVGVRVLFRLKVCVLFLPGPQNPATLWKLKEVGQNGWKTVLVEGL